ncbi:MAG: PfkB family carbohydrate kinase, partial [Nanoarchaeota archaeon]
MDNIVLTTKSFAKVRVMVVGDFMLDKSFFGEVTRVSPESTVPVFLEQYKTFTPGGAGNSTVNIAALGAHVLTVGTLGNDEHAENFMESITSLVGKLPGGIDTSGLELSDNAQTTTKIRFFATNRNNMPTGLRHDKETPGLHVDDKNKIVNTIIANKNYYDVVLLSDYSKGIAKKGVVFAIKNLGIPLIVDPRTAAYLSYADARLIKPNDHEARAMLSKLDPRYDPSDT